MNYFDYNPVERIVDILISRGSFGDRIKLTKYQGTYKLQLFRKGKEVINQIYPEDNIREKLIVTFKLILSPSDSLKLLMDSRYNHLFPKFNPDTMKCYTKDWRSYIRRCNNNYDYICK